MYIEEYYKALEMAKECNIPIGKVSGVRINPRLTRSWGRCLKKKDGTFEIEISKIIMDDSTTEGILNTILHELIHTCKGCFNHGEMWKRYADVLNKRYGLQIKRLSMPEEKGVHKEIAKYTLQCQKCGNKFRYTRKTKLVQNPDRFRCGCGGKIVLL